MTGARYGPHFKTDPATGCWNWVRYVNKQGYAINGTHKAGTRKAHRWYWELVYGKLPDDLDIDHLCRNRRCVNPAHLEPVTRGENQRRGVSPWGQNAQKTHCVNGHELTGDNIYPSSHRPTRPESRECRLCARERARAAYLRGKASR
jgi:hypothetical protein